MTVKTGQAWAGTFVTLDATGALAAGTPSGVLYVDGVADAATVTITGSNPYKWSVTLPALTAGQRVDMYITATISTIATASVVASEQVDTALVSDVKTDTAAILADTGTDGVIVASGTVTSITNGVTLADDAITAAKFDESTAFPVKSADTGATQIARVGADSDTLETLSDQIDGITSAGIADSIWDEALAGHAVAGSAGAALTAAGAASGSGATAKTYTVTDGTNPLSGVHVWVTTDLSGTNIVASGYTDDLGEVIFYLDSGTSYYLWRQKRGYEFTNPDIQTA